MKSSNVIVRHATQSDLRGIERHYGGPLDSIGDPFCDVGQIQDSRLDWLLIAELDGEYAGFLYWHLGQKPFFAPEVEKFAHIRQISVLEKFQEQGIGKKLMVYATERLKALVIVVLAWLWLGRVNGFYSGLLPKYNWVDFPAIETFWLPVAPLIVCWIIIVLGTVVHISNRLSGRL